ncbi:hypothetical protein JYU34_010447 [Plutella xylostella]|uniref:CCHC-type domain-containing protein n=1 Tax=Plutella xylostella TaxID=51655 RepID=A0ABQ7QID9_PLUXY|nr:hypothetical protein JYU34_010447 [Plutella xylostella]
MANSGFGQYGNNLTFDHRTQDWSIFISRFNQYCLANDLTDDTDKAGKRRCAILLTALVEDTYRVARDLVFPESLDKIVLLTLVDKLNQHFQSKKCSFAERYNFYKAEQRPGEDLAEWAARVRSLAQFCGFNTELDTALRDRFVLGLENAKEKEKLFSESMDTLTFSKALELAQSVRCARLALQSTSVTSAAVAAAGSDVFALRAAAAPGGAGGPRAASPATNPISRKCVVCGYKNHTKNECRYAEYPCKKCNQKGHLSRMCKSKIKRNNFLAQDADDILEDLTM